MTVKTKNLTRNFLVGGDRRSIGKVKKILKTIKTERKFKELMACLSDTDEIVRMRAADAMEKISFLHPEWFVPYINLLLKDVALSSQIEVRWHLAQILARLHLTRPQKLRAVEVLKTYLDDSSSIVKAWSLTALFYLSKNDKHLRLSLEPVFQDALENGTLAMKARMRSLLSEASKPKK